LPEVHAFLGGDGPALEENKRLARQLGVADRAHFLGRLDDVEKVPVFYAGDAYLLPTLTRNESFGIVQVEAQLCRRPVVTSEIGGAPEVTVDGETGLTVPPGDLDALTAAVERLVEDDALRERLGEGGYRRAKEHYVEAVTVPRMRRFFNGLEQQLKRDGRL
jgi:rhamnosyl/mannosyltransferase